MRTPAAQPACGACRRPGNRSAHRPSGAAAPTIRPALCPGPSTYGTRANPAHRKTSQAVCYVLARNCRCGVSQECVESQPAMCASATKRAARHPHPSRVGALVAPHAATPPSRDAAKGGRACLSSSPNLSPATPCCRAVSRNKFPPRRRPESQHGMSPRPCYVSARKLIAGGNDNQLGGENNAGAHTARSHIGGIE